MPHRDFDVPEVDETDDDPISFGLAGRTVRCLPSVPLGVRLALTDGAMLSKAQVIEFVRGVVRPDDEAVLHAALADKRRPATAEHLEAVFWYLVDVYADRSGDRVAERLPDDTPPPADGTDG